MKSQMTVVWSLVVLAPFANSLADADDAPKLPNQYAEAVLDVQGMI